MSCVVSCKSSPKTTPNSCLTIIKPRIYDGFSNEYLSVDDMRFDSVIAHNYCNQCPDDPTYANMCRELKEYDSKIKQ